MATEDGRILIVSKSLSGSTVYVTPEPFADGAFQTLQPVGNVEVDSDSLFGKLTTGGDISPDGTRVVVRTYLKAYEWKRPPGATWSQVWRSKPTVFALPQTQQGEAICYGLDGQSLFTTSEKLPAPLWRLAATAKK
jgi:hypothetical protein